MLYAALKVICPAAATIDLMTDLVGKMFTMNAGDIFLTGYGVWRDETNPHNYRACGYGIRVVGIGGRYMGVLAEGL